MKPDAILTSDIEFRIHKPLCRLDDHFEAQAKKLTWLTKLQRTYRCPIFDAGDLFDKRYKAHPNHELLAYVAKNLPDDFYTIPGNHDLPGNSIEKYKGSAMRVLEESEILQVPYKDPVCISQNIRLHGFPWEVSIRDIPKNNKINVAIIHTMVYEKSPPWTGCEGYKALDLLKKLSNFKLIVTGHHHRTFVCQYKDRLLVNPGSFMRNDADQEHHKPCVFLWYSKTNAIKKIHIPIEKNVITREHLDSKIQQEQRLDALLKVLGHSEKFGVNFYDNLNRTCESKNLNKLVKKKIWEYYETT